jgi:hypothetical protein
MNYAALDGITEGTAAADEFLKVMVETVRFFSHSRSGF